MKNSNSMRSTKRDGGRLVSFTQLGGKKLRCNKCGEKINRSQTESHENSHSGPKKSSKNIERINSEIRELVGIVLNTKKTIYSRNLLHFTLNKRGIIDRFYKLMKIVENLPMQEKAKINSRSINEIKQELGN